MNKRAEIPNLLDQITYFSHKTKEKILSKYQSFSDEKSQKVYDFLVNSIQTHKKKDAEDLQKNSENIKNTKKQLNSIHLQESIVRAQEILELAALEEELNNLIA